MLFAYHFVRMHRLNWFELCEGKASTKEPYFTSKKTMNNMPGYVVIYIKKMYCFKTNR